MKEELGFKSYIMKYLKKTLPVLILVSIVTGRAQQSPIAGLRSKLANAPDDTSKAYILDSLSMYYMFFTDRYDSSFYYLEKSVDNAFQLPDKKYLILAYARLGFYYLNTSQYNAGLNIAIKGLQLAEQYNIDQYTSTLYYDISFIYYNLNDSALSMRNAGSGLQKLAVNKDPFYDIPLHLYGHISSIYSGGKNTDSALYYLHKLDSVVQTSKERAAKDISYYYWTSYYLDNTDYAHCDSVVSLGIESCKKNGDFLLKSFYVYRTVSYFNQQRYKEALVAGKFASDVMDKAGQASVLGLLQASYDKLGKIDSAYFYLKASDSLHRAVQNQSNVYEAQQVLFDQQLKKKETQANAILEQEKSRNRMITYIFLTALLFFFLFGFIQWNNNLQKKKANGLLKDEKRKVENALQELRSTQAQLIQSEKMASLGELTSGIAHEIQNPLNFVNNFSELNKEMLVELKDEIDKGNIDDARTIADSIILNEDKINHHGKRADAIVKGMLLHSLAGTGIREMTDVNALCDEYLKLSYRSFHAKTKMLRVDLRTDLDERIGKINIVPRDIGRVLLNLFNNAFYAVQEKSGVSDESYRPEVVVQTKKINDILEIRVADNGRGMSESIINKIFQPFFTTKPPGLGTGLGLSLAYDIVTKAYNGTIKAESKEGEGATIIIRLPA